MKAKKKIASESQTGGKMRRATDFKQRIRDAASALMIECGYTGATISAISRRSGLPISSLYWHFGSKEGLLIAVAREGVDTWLSLVPPWEEFAGSLADRLDQMFREWARQGVQRPELIRILLMLYLERGNLSAKAVRMIQQVRASALDSLRPAMCELIKSAQIDPELVVDDLGNLCLSLINGFFVDYHIAPETTDLTHRFTLLPALLRAAIDDFKRAPRPRGVMPGNSVVTRGENEGSSRFAV